MSRIPTELARARTVLRRAVELDGKSASALAALGLTLLLPPSDPAGAESYLERAVQSAPTRDDYTLSLANALIELQKTTAAAAVLEPLMARGDAGVREAARRMLASATTPLDRAATPPVASASSGSAPAPVRVGGAVRPPTKVRDV